METPRLDAATIHAIMVRRGPNPPGPLAVYAALYQAGETGVPEDALIERVRWGDRRSYATVLRNLSRRVARIAGDRSRDVRALFAEHHGRSGRRLALRPEVVGVVEADVDLRQFLMRPVDEILAMRNPADPEGDKSRWPRFRRL